jgi:hypothetical protein
MKVGLRLTRKDASDCAPVPATHEYRNYVLL